MKAPPPIAQLQARLHKEFSLVGRDREIELLVHCVRAGKHVLLEGPVGVGKTFLVSAVAQLLGREVVRVDGDSRYTEQKLTGWFDPPSVLKKGYGKESYFDGPLAQALRGGSILFINELNRMPEGVQNVLLPALDEKLLELPRIGKLAAKPGFTVIATQNPREFVATSHLSEALLDRFELVTLSYQSEQEERDILKGNSPASKPDEAEENLREWCLQLVRATRSSALFKRGASIRAAISIHDIAGSMGGSWEDFLRAALVALPTRVELSEDGMEQGLRGVLESLAEQIEKKKPQPKAIKLEYGELPTPAQNAEPEIKLHPPETLTEEGDGAVENLSESDWDKALHYHETKKRLDELKRAEVRAAAIRAIVRKALATMGAVARPYDLKNAPWSQFPQEEFDLEASLEEDPTLQNLVVEKREARRAEVIICIDTSLSMTGRKLALTAVALAVLALQLEPEDLCVIAFESDASLVKPLGTRKSLYELLKDFMEVPARGLTNIEAGLLLAEKQARGGNLPKKAVILMTDGRFTAGKNPAYLVPRLPRLHVVQTGNPWSSPRFCRDLARQGRGKFVRVAQLEHLPKALYALVGGIIR